MEFTSRLLRILRMLRILKQKTSGHNKSGVSPCITGPDSGMGERGSCPGPPQMKSPAQRQTPRPPDKRASSQRVWAPLSGGFLEWGPLEWGPIE
jgi:hypothetical protein